MKTKNNFDSLLREYKELQLRVTRFSYIEQQLINAKDKLDHELVLYKRLNKFSNSALKSNKLEDFLTMSVEGIIDVLEVEASAILIVEKDTGNTLFFNESLHLKDGGEQQKIASDLLNLAEIVAKSKSSVISSKRLSLFDYLSAYSDAVFHFAEDKTLNLSVYLIGLVSVKKAPFYERLNDKHETIFSLFAQQFLSILTNFYQNKKIQDQIVKISSSEIELKKLSLIATKTKNGVIITDEKGVIEWINESFVKMSGYFFEDVYGKQTKDLFDNFIVEFSEKKKISKALKNKQNIELTLLNNTKEGKLYYSQIEIIPVFDELKRHINNIFVIKDITNEVEFKAEILRMNSRFELISAKSQIGIWEWNKELNDSTWNDILINQYGADRALIQNGFYSFWLNSLHPEDKKRVIDNRDKVLNCEIDSIVQDYRIIRQNDQSVRYLRTLTIGEKNAKGEVIRLVGSSIDITDTKIADEKVASLKQFYESILNHLPNKIAVFNNTCELIYFNEAMLECNPFWQDYLFKSVYDVYTADANNQSIVNKLIFHMQNAIKDKKAVKYEDMVLKNGKEVELLNTVLPFFNNDKLEYIILSGVDISELNKIQKDLLKNNVELQKVNSELDNFVYRVSHDLRSPLLSIKGLISLIDYDEVNPSLVEYIKLIESSASRMDSSIQDILEYSRNSRLAVKLEDVNLKEMVFEIFNDIKYSGDSNIDLIYESNGDDNIITDKFRISVLLKNLIGNSVKYKKNNTHSFVKFSLSKRNNKMISFKISDNGQGIDKISLPRVFEMFYRGCSTSVGSGLGLYICKEIAEKLSGTLSLKSKKEIGTEVNVKLPINNF
ncbi:ATP-binding protein [Flavobacterium sp. TBRC 19031]|uniref:ATP-binding protein n=1 Tax=Flavobacterium mekongense TaxID=3379707 RepID=UPI00399B804D